MSEKLGPTALAHELGEGLVTRDSREELMRVHGREIVRAWEAKEHATGGLMVWKR